MKKCCVHFSVSLSSPSVVCPTVTHEHFRNTMFLSSTPPHTSYIPRPLLICSHIRSTSKSSFPTHFLYVLQNCHSPRTLHPPFSVALPVPLFEGDCCFRGGCGGESSNLRGREKQKREDSSRVSISILYCQGCSTMADTFQEVALLMYAELLHWINQQLS